ncbi:hypothetical protein M3Y98_01001200 [Aphelenchoides besseyi]|nr:hypothetical protein M3Y98_01001200 [Aphelenchoides besseyi]KAI6195156.1 hypothetical protein M3Y96_01201000 [Aphelenchoides besseyi]
MLSEWYIDYLLTSINIAIQIYVIGLIIFRSPSTIREYRRFLIRFSVCLEVMFLDNFRGIATSFGAFACQLTGPIAMFITVQVVIMQFYCLSYRFTAVHKRPAIRRIFMSWPFTVGVYVFTAVFSIAISLLLWSIMQTPDEVRSDLLKIRDFGSPISIDEPIIGLKTKSPIFGLFMLTIFICLLIYEVASITLIAIILHTLHQTHTAMSKSTYRLQIELVKVLIAQLITPIILIISPVVSAIVAIMRGVNASALTIEAGFLALTCYGKRI